MGRQSRRWPFVLIASPRGGGKTASPTLTQWGERAHELGWTARDLFGLSEVPANPAPLYSRMSRYDETGLLWLLEGRKTVVAMTTDTAAVRHPSGSITMYRRHRKPALGPLGDSLDDL